MLDDPRLTNQEIVNHLVEQGLYISLIFNFKGDKCVDFMAKKFRRVSNEPFWSDDRYAPLFEIWANRTLSKKFSIVGGCVVRCHEDDAAVMSMTFPHRPLT
jgi:hypothetical protein